jgi:hypothetical protein
MAKKLIFIGLCIFFQSCIVPKCKDDMAFLFDRRGRPIQGKAKKDPLPIFMKRCPIENCKTRKIHCHGNGKYRGTPWWKFQNPQPGQDFEQNMDK